MPIALSFTLKCTRCTDFYFSIWHDYLLTHMKDSFALTKLRERPRPMPALFAFTFLYFSIFKLNAYGSWATIINSRNPKPPRKLQKLTIIPHKSHAESQTDSWFAIHQIIAGSKPCWMSGKSSKEKEAFAWFLWWIPRSLWAICP